MDNQHKKITGYRDLTQAEIDTINEIKELGKEMSRLCERIQYHVPDTDQRWCSIGKEHLQIGLMSLTRAVARPESF